MTENPAVSANQQWQTLHNNNESYEQYALIIKLIATSLTVISVALTLNSMLIFCIIAILWLQEAIWKTYQCRLSDAIIKVEQENNDIYKLYSQWQQNRQSTVELINEYISSALKPTVIFPYAPLIVVALIFN